MLQKVLRWLSFGLALLALVAGTILLLRAGNPPVGIPAAAISAAPLLLVGAAFLILQPVLRPQPSELLKNVLLAATFLLWGLLQFLPQNALSAWLGNLVIALYVVDLAWVILAMKNSPKAN
jgi:FtsH-binding integral membrane protein